MIVLLTGLPRAGKTTVLEKFIQKYQGDCFWILSKEIRNDAKERVGFEAVTSDGRKGIFAHKEKIHSENVIGSYRVDLEIVDQLFTENILRESQNPKRLLIIDEIGRMEMLSAEFAQAIDALFNTNVPVLATIRHGDEWAEKYKMNPNATVVEVTEQNREQLTEILIGLFSGKTP